MTARRLSAEGSDRDAAIELIAKPDGTVRMVIRADQFQIAQETRK